MTNKVRSKKPYNVEARLKIKNFALIENADITFKEFSIIVGPNNSGKSYIVMILYVISRTLAFFVDKTRSLAQPLEAKSKYFKFEKEKFNLLKNEMEKTIETFKKSTNKDTFQFTPEAISLIKELSEKEISGIIRDYSQKTLETTFGSSLSSLLGKAKGGTEVTCYLNKKLQISMKISRKGKFSFGINFPEFIPGSLNIFNENLTYLKDFIVDHPGNEKLNIRFTDEILIHLIQESIRYIQKISHHFDNTYYLPASRSGFLLSQKALFYSLLETAKFAGISNGGIDIPALPGPVADFLKETIFLEKNKKELYEYFEKDLELFEKKIFKGTVEVEFDNKFKLSYPEIYYVDPRSDTKIPVFRASSGITEMIPFYLYLKYKLEPGDILIVEEPESHLHPEIQFELVRLCIRLINRGVKIIFTTHSDFILSSINIFLKAHSKKLKSPDCEKLGIDEKHERLDKKIISIINMNDSGQAENLEIEDEIPDDEFYRVVEELYNLLAKIDNHIDNTNET